MVATELVEEDDVNEDNVKSRESADFEDSTQDGPREKPKARVVDEQRPFAQTGTRTKNPQAKMTAYYEIGSSGIRWENVAHDLGNGFKDGRKWRFRKKRRAGSELTEDEQESGDDAENTTNPSLPVIIGSICGSVLFLRMLIALVYFWYVVELLFLIP